MKMTANTYDNLPVNLHGPNMLDYEETVATYQFTIPEYFNFGFDVLDRWAKDRTKLAMVWADRTGEEIRKYSFYDLQCLSNRFANVLRDLGFRKGDRLFVMVPRQVEWYAVMLGCFKLGVIPLPGPNILVPKDIAYRINQAEAVGAVVWHENAEKLEAAKGDCPSLKHLVSLGEKRDGWHSFEELMAQASPRLSRDEVEPTRADDVMLIYFTSGTTRFPKMVPHTQASYGIGHIITAKFWQDLKPTDLHWTLSDTGWAKAAWGKLFGQWQIGCAIMVHDADAKFNAKTHLKLMESCGVTTFCAPPTVYRMLVLEDLSRYDLTGIRHSLAAGEPLNPEIIKVWQEHTGTTIYDGFGQTESVNLIANYPCMEIRPGSMGKPTPGFVVELIDDDGNPVPQGEEGNIAVRVKPEPPVGLLGEYWRNEEATRESFVGDWYYTGDKATKDEDGYFWFVGRADDVINASGYRIGPFEVESALQSHPAVAESAVVGSPDPLRGTIVKAFIILSPGFEPSDELVTEIQEHVKAETAPYKYPREIEFMKELPKTISGKIRRVELRQREEQKKAQ
ncbi:acyl-CoA synthetase [Geothermobacter hydrogeniphilus]|uniref:Acyl-CoA synthetase n=1 Tax=Geothermobacter hydrogeniphilus TaxID=1969733 RepID=A0A2K2HE05_9BACT|nr:acyl-CoA synthetase [Geothermobacter hydrogeniphilus]